MLRAFILSLVLLTPVSAMALDSGFTDSDRTANRSVIGEIFYPDHMMNKPEHYEFLPLVSNHDVQNQHDAQWVGQDWEPAAWNHKWTPDAALDKLFRHGVFYKQYTRSGRGSTLEVPVLEVGPRFYKISDLDQRRSLKLLADQAGIFKGSAQMIELRDWYTHKNIGVYTPRGLYLN